MLTSCAVLIQRFAVSVEFLVHRLERTVLNNLSKGNQPFTATITVTSQHLEAVRQQLENDHKQIKQQAKQITFRKMQRAENQSTCDPDHVHRAFKRACKSIHTPPHAFIAWLEAHPAFSVACSDCDFAADLLVHPLYCLASRSSVQRWEVMFRCRAPSHAHAQQWNVHGIDVGVKQRRAVLVKAALCEVLVQRLMSFQRAICVRHPLHVAKHIVSRRHFVGKHKNQAECLFQEGHRLYGEQRFSDAAKSWGQAVLLQHAASHAFLSVMLIEGRPGVGGHDGKRAFELAAAGAAMGCAHSLGMLARCYDSGSGVSQDHARGLALGRQSAAAGSCFGQAVVGFCYWLGKGVASNQAEAERWLRLAALQGHRISQAQVGTIYDRMQNYAEAARFWRLASAQGHGQSTLSLARLYEDGTGVAHDKTEAARLCRLAAEQGVSDSTCLLRLLMLI
jgi:hypothetical protein